MTSSSLDLILPLKGEDGTQGRERSKGEDGMDLVKVQAPENVTAP